jgi:hypothetical protein
MRVDLRQFNAHRLSLPGVTPFGYGHSPVLGDEKRLPWSKTASTPKHAPSRSPVGREHGRPFLAIRDDGEGVPREVRLLLKD